MSSGNDSNEFPPGEGGPHEAGAGGDMPLNTGRPAVAAAPGKLVFVLLFAGIFIFIIVRSLFFGEKHETVKVEHGKEHVVGSNTGGGGDVSIAPGSLPTPPSELTTPNPVPPPTLPPPPPPLITPPAPDLHAGAPTNEALSRRIHAAMFVVSGGGKNSAGGAAKRKSAVVGANDPNSAFAASIAESDGSKAVATRIDSLGSTIVQGKLIQAVLESAISSDLPTPIRAIISHDVYAEAGKVILIPKGSRLIGTYNAQLRKGQSRVFIIWQRLVRPDGIDIGIDSPGVDLLGRGGMGGDVDNKYFEQFSTSIMTSTLEIGVAAVGDALFGSQQTTTTNNGSGSTTTQSPTATAMTQAVTNVGQIGTNIVNNTLNLQPTISIDQGTPINVFVNRDLFFPPEVTGANAGFIQ